MEVIYKLSNIGETHQNAIMTIGNFDGVHGGHQAMLKSMVADAHANHAKAGVITFEPYPQEYFKKSEGFIRLTSFREKYQVLKDLGIDFVVVLAFNQTLSQLSAEMFITKILVDTLKIQGLWIGDDFRFGRNREGDFTLLSRLATINGFSVRQVSTVVDSHERISSTRIRRLLINGELSEAKRLLGRDYALVGRVQSGEQRGTRIGFPTANICLTSLVPLSGVFVVRVKSTAFEGIKHGVANIGTRPTVDGKGRWLEVHIFDFNGNLYHQRIEVLFIQKLRDEKKFNSLDELVQQIQEDVRQAKAYHD